MIASDLIRKTDQLKIKLWVEAGRLKFRAPKGVMTPEIRNDLESCKDEVINILLQKEAEKELTSPLSYNQQSLWFLHQLAPESPCYNVALACRIVSKIDTASMLAATRKLIFRHRILRTTYHSFADYKEGKICQIIHPELEADIHQVDVAGFTENELQQKVNEYYSIPFDLENGPIFRICLFRKIENDYVLLITIHHIACDAASMSILLDDFQKLYSSESTGKIADLPESIWQYTDFVKWQKNLVQGEKGDHLKHFWKEQLTGATPFLDLPTDYERPVIQQFNGSSLPFLIGGENYKAIMAFTKKEKVTPYVFLLAVFQTVLMRYSNQEDIIVGTPALGRNCADHSGICGDFINPIVMRSDLSGNLSFRDHLNKTRRVVLRALDHQEYPFSLLVENLMPVRSQSHSPVFQVMFNLLNHKMLGSAAEFLTGASSETPVNFGNLKILPFHLDQQEGQFDLTLEIVDTEASFACVLKYCTDLFKSETAACFTEDFQKYLQLIMDEPEICVSELPDPVYTGAKKIESEVFREKKKIIIAGNFTVEPLEPFLEFWTEKIDIASEIIVSPYNQVFQQLLDPSSLFFENSDGANIIIIRFDDWFKGKEDFPIVLDKPRAFKEIKQNGDEFVLALKSAVESVATPFLICFCPSASDNLADEEFAAFIKKTEEELIGKLTRMNGVFSISTHELTQKYPVLNYYEPMGEKIGHIPYTQEFFSSLSINISRKLYSILNDPYKAIVLDCDNTLWKGIVGEDGPIGVKVGAEWQAFQQLMVAQYNAGKLICLCSKNEEADVFEVFDNHPDMILKREHIAFSRINWLPKSQNIISMAEEINIGLDSFIFVDDNPVECAEVGSNCPEVLSLQMPVHPAEVEEFANHTWVFDNLKTTTEDSQRTDFYRKASEREKLLKTSLSFGDFINGLELDIKISNISEDQISRVSQLTQRTNQFNFTTKRRKESEIQKLCNLDNYVCQVAEVSDRFGDYGLVGVLILEIKSESIVVDTFLLSCRVLGRGVEYKMISDLGKYALESRKKDIEFQFYPTQKNTPALNFLQSICVEFKVDTETEKICSITSEDAVKIKFNTSSAEQDHDSQEDKQPKVDSTKQINSAAKISQLMKNISKELSDPDKVLGAVNEYSKEKAALRSNSGLDGSFVLPGTSTEKEITSVWRDVLGIERVGNNNKFFELGGKSILMPRVVIQLTKLFGIRVSLVDMLQHPTVELMAKYIDSKVNKDPRLVSDDETALVSHKRTKDDYFGDVAIIGMSGRFPGAANVSQLWHNLINGIEAITEFSDEELEKCGVPKALIENVNYVKRSPILDAPDMFDATFFGYSPREAEHIDPQQRIFLECAWHALEDAGYDPEQYGGLIGVYAGCGMNNYFLKNILSRQDLFESILNFSTFIANDKDFLTTRVSYKLGLQGPSMGIQTACSTSLVATQLACQGLQTHQCDVALCGGVSLQIPRLRGYLYNEGEIFSPDGYCRPFDKDASGTLLGEGVGIVVLKRLEDAVAARDHIYAVIKAAAVNNDGNLKMGYTAPSVHGQSEVISKAHSIAEINPESLGYIEAHGTGTKLGDPLEVAALSQVFRQKTDKKNFCAIGSVKSNIGHLDVAAGVAGLIKTALALKYKKIPPTLNYSKPNPELCIEESPFYINSQLLDWEAANIPRRAGISSFGVGGTNVHMVLEEAPGKNQTIKIKPWSLIVLSARTKEALSASAKNLKEHLIANPETSISDAAFTLQLGRRAFRFRQGIVCRDIDDAIESFENASSGMSSLGSCELSNRPVAFMFTGQGLQHLNMAKDLYQNVSFFKEKMDYCSKVLKTFTGYDLCKLIYPLENEKDFEDKLNQTSVSQPALFVIEYCLARLWMAWGLKPHSMIGHSIGEYVAACLAGVFSLEDALRLVAARAQLMQKQPRGSMLAVSLSENEIKPFLEVGTSVAIINTPSRCIVSGPDELIQRLKEKISVSCSVLNTSHAFHSQMMGAAVEPFTELVKTLDLKPPQIPFVSNVTGTWITDEQAISPDYWGQHLRQPVQLSAGLNTLLEESEIILLEVGPGNSLCSIARQNAINNSSSKIFASMRRATVTFDDEAFLLNTLSQLWVAGISVNWHEIQKGMKCGRIPLPGYPFERQSYWIKAIEQEGHLDRIHSYGNEIENYKETSIEEKGIQSVSSSRFGTSSNYQSPMNQVEKDLVDIWKDVLGFKRIGIKDNFFELGGDSLIAVQIITRIRKKFNNDLPIQKLLEIPTIAQIADVINSSEFLAEPIFSPIKKIQRDKHFPLSLSQQRLWFINQIEPFSPVYNIVQAVKIKGEVSEEILQKSFDIILDRHESLKSVFKTLDGLPNAELSDYDSIKIQKIKIDKLDSEDNESFARAWVRDNAPTLFDLEKGPLVRAILFNTGMSESYFVLVLHHIIADGWSMGIWMKEISIVYDELKFNKPSSLPDLHIQYADYVYWQRTVLEQKDLIKQIAYWKKQLDGASPGLQLPEDYSRPAEPKHTGNVKFFSIPLELTKKLVTLSNKETTSPNVVVLAAYMLFLSKHSGQKDIIVGSPYANRDQIETEKLIGFFLNMLPIRVQLSDSDSFIDLIRKVHETSFEALANKDLPFEQIVEIVQPERSLNHHPLFQVMFAFQNFPIPVIEGSDMTLYPIVMDRGSAEYDFSLYMWEEKDEFCGVFEYSSELFKLETIEGMTVRFLTLLDNIASGPGNRLNAISMLPENEKNQLLLDFNDTVMEYPHNLCLHELFELQVERTPESLAVIFEKDRLTYFELNNRLNQLANYLRRLGIGPGDLVGIFMDRSIEMLISTLGVLKAGAGYVPLDPDYPEDRLAYMLEDSKASVLLTQEILSSELPETEVKIVCIDSENDIITKMDRNESEGNNNLLKPSPENLAYVIYTSGSTGKPKGVQVPHGAVVNFLCAMSRKPGFTKNDILLAVTTLSFDIHVLELYLPLINGGTTVIVSREIASDGIRLAEAISESKSTVMQATPSTWRLLLSTGWEGSPGLKILCGGEAFPKDLLRDLIGRSASVWNMYGPTETTVWSTCCHIINAEKPILIGKPIGNTQIYILDSHMNPVPVGVPGEMYIGGSGVTHGYLNRPELTAKQFVPDPFSNKQGAIFYRTGDLVKYHPDGNIEYLNRIDNQVKVRGFRIELGEIETALGSHFAVKQSIVTVNEDRPGDVRLVAFIMPETGKDCTGTELRKHLRKSLPDYMIPQHFNEIEQMPLTPAGKVDRKKLQASFVMERSGDDEFVEPKSENEKLLAKIWKEKLDFDRISVHDNFFNIGGHSLLVMQVISVVMKETGIKLSPRDFLLNTLGQIAEKYQFKGDVTEDKIKEEGFFKSLTKFFKKK